MPAGPFELLLGVEAIALVGVLGLLVRRAVAGRAGASPGTDAGLPVLRAVTAIGVMALLAAGAMLLAWFTTAAHYPGWHTPLGSTYSLLFVAAYGTTLSLLMWLCR